MRYSNLILILAGVYFLFSGRSGAEPLKWESAATLKKVDSKVAEIMKIVKGGPFKDQWDSLKDYQAPDWYRDAKFGIFIHWGLYSVPGYANEWYSRNMYQQGDDAFKHHLATYGAQTQFGYKDFIPLFKAEKFDPQHWAKLFKDAGAKYVVPVAEHHDGFAMYDSDFSDWTAKKMGPKRDVIGELANAVRAEGLVFGLSSHRAEHWWFMNGGMKFDSDVQDPKYADFYGPAQPDDTAPDDEYLKNWLARSSELVDKYHPQLVYFDWWIGEKMAFDPYVRKFAAYYYDRAAQWKEGVVLNTKDKAFVPGTSVQDVEKGKLPGINPVPWQTDTSVSWKSWAYLKDDQLKDAGYLIRTLIDTVSRNGNLLLDIGPKPDGTIPEEQEKILLQIGDWLKVNGEAIYGTRPWITYGEGPTQEAGGKFSETDVKYQEGDVRYTRNGNILYIIPMVCPTKPLMVRWLAGPNFTVQEVSLLGSQEKVRWERTNKGYTFSPPSHPSSLPVVYKALLTGYGFSRGNIKANKYEVTLESAIQNYNQTPVTLVAFLYLDDIKVGGGGSVSQKLEVPADSTLYFNLSCQANHPSIYAVEANSYQPIDVLESHMFRTVFASDQMALPSIDLVGEWLFAKGDDSAWLDKDFDDKAWEQVKLPCKWEDHGYKCEYCYGWYRKHIFIPAEWKGHSLILPLGKIDDADITYFNGKEIGRMGDKTNTAWNQERRYEVPASSILYGQDNVIAIRVYNITGGAGLYDGPLGPVEVK